MGVFRRHQPPGLEQALKGVTIRTDAKSRDSFAIRAGEDGLVHETCFFCGGELVVDMHAPTGEAAAVMIEPVGPGEPLHGLCHRECAERAKGSLGL
jgi:hypothetical protein